MTNYFYKTKNSFLCTTIDMYMKNYFYKISFLGAGDVGMMIGVLVGCSYMGYTAAIWLLLGCTAVTTANFGCRILPLGSPNLGSFWCFFMKKLVLCRKYAVFE